MFWPYVIVSIISMVVVSLGLIYIGLEPLHAILASLSTKGITGWWIVKKFKKHRENKNGGSAK